MSRILLVDDNEPFRKALARIVESLGHEAFQAGDGQRALTVLARSEVDMVFTDVFMPDMDGIEFLIRLKEEHPEIPVVAMSGGGAATKDFVLEDAAQLGADETLAKPLTYEMVDEAIRRHLATGV
jgi:CheY-like chemotaxis protein